MRRLFVPVILALTIVLGATGVQAGNQEEAKFIAQKLGAKYPQYNIDVAYLDGKVILKGEVTSEAEKLEMTEFVQSFPKVKSVRERILVKDSTVSLQKAAKQNQENSSILAASSLLPTALPSANQIEQGKVRAVAGEAPVSPLYVSQLPASEEEVVYVDNEVMASPMNQPATVTRSPSDYLAPRGYSATPGQNGQANLPNYAWPSYAEYPNYSQVGYPKQYAAGAFPYIGPFYPYPQVPLGWRKVTMEWHDGYWWLDFNDGVNDGPFSPLFRQPTTYR